MDVLMLIITLCKTKYNQNGYGYTIDDICFRLTIFFYILKFILSKKNASLPQIRIKYDSRLASV